jgi:hypothetical protein
MDAHLRKLQRAAHTGDPEDMQRYIAALEWVAGSDPKYLRRSIWRAIRALEPFAKLAGEVDGDPAPWYLDDDDILRAQKIHQELEKLL